MTEIQTGQESMRHETFEERVKNFKETVLTGEEILNRLENKYGNALKREDLNLLERVLGTDFMKLVLLMKPTKDVIIDSKTQNEDIQVKSIEHLISEIRSLELQKGVNSLQQISLTIDELKEFQIRLLTEDTKDEIEYLQEQIKDSIEKPTKSSSYDIVKGSDLEKTLIEKHGTEKAKEIMDSMDNFWLSFVSDITKSEGLTLLVKDNIATGLNFLFMDLLSKQSQDQQNEIVEKIKGLTQTPVNIAGFMSLVKSFALGENKVFNKIESLLGLINTFAQKKKDDPNWSCDKNKILSNPYEFYKLSNDYINGATDQYIFDTLNKGEVADFKEIKLSKTQKDSLQKIATSVSKGNQVEIFEGINTLKIEGKKEFMKSGEVIMEIKEFFDMLGLGELLVKLLDWICKFMGFEGGFSGFEKEYILGKLDITNQQRESIKNLMGEYKSNQTKSDENNDSKERKTKLSKEMNFQKTDPEYMIIDSFNISVYKKTLEKTSIEGVSGKKYSKYFIPNSIIVRYADKYKLDIKGTDGKVDSTKLNNLTLNEKIENEIINDFLFDNTKQLLSDSDIKSKIINSQDLAFLTYTNYISSNNSIERSRQLLHYKDYLTASDIALRDGNVSPRKDRYIPGNTMPSSKFNELFKGGDKKLGELNFEQIQKLSLKIFGDGPGTQLMFKLSQGNPCFVARIIALARHEGGLQFGRENRDPNPTQENIGTFQISAPARNGMTARQAVREKYEQTITVCEKMCTANGISIDKVALNSAQKDLLSWFGYVKSQRGGENTFNKLRNPNLSDSDIAYLMSTTIQGGIGAIGKSVVTQIKYLPVDISKI